MVDLNFQQMGLEVGSGAVVGAIIGFAAKKLAKVIAVIIGIQLALFKFLETRGILQVNWDAISQTTNDVMGNASAGGGEAIGATPPSWITSLLSTLPVSAGFSAGFFVGFKRG